MYMIYPVLLYAASRGHIPTHLQNPEDPYPSAVARGCYVDVLCVLLVTFYVSQALVGAHQGFQGVCGVF